MRRRDFIALAGGAAATWPIAARAQQAALPVIGFLNGGSPTALSARAAAFRDGLGDVGWVEGRNVAIEYRWGQGSYDELPEFALDLVRRRVAVIAATGGLPSLRAAMRATSEIPIVFTMSSDPVELGLVASLNRPGANVTGITLLSEPIVLKRIGLLRDLIPDAKTIAVLMNSADSSAETELGFAQRAAGLLGLQVKTLRAIGEQDLDMAFKPLAQERAGALLVTTNPIFESRRDQIVALAARYAVPAIYPLREYAAPGGLMCYGASVTDVYHQCGSYVGRILKGEKPADLPIQLPSKFEFVINTKTAKALGLTCPPVLLATADQVIE
jgi:putative tryptophan/tyrosine transport system substrate-binding protein